MIWACVAYPTWGGGGRELHKAFIFSSRPVEKPNCLIKMAVLKAYGWYHSKYICAEQLYAAMPFHHMLARSLQLFCNFFCEFPISLALKIHDFNWRAPDSNRSPLYRDGDEELTF